MKKILLVNNQEAFLDRNKSLLNRAGFLIITATNIEDGYRICQNQRVDLVISLLDMPEGGGDQLCSLIRKHDDLKKIPFVLVCYPYDHELERASRCGANGVVSKPVRPDLLLEKVGNFLKVAARRDFRAEFNAVVSGMSETVPFSGMTRNISVSGVLCETEMVLHQGDSLTSLLFKIDDRQILADGRVVWSELMPGGLFHYGVQFTNLAPEYRSRIEEYVAAPQSLLF